MKSRKQIFVTFQKTGVHRYPDAATNPNLADVSYLGAPHRHKFFFKVIIDVTHNDRELEFHQVLNWIESLYTIGGTLNLDYKSCEMIGEDLYKQISEKYPNRTISIEVSEDNECGAIMTFNE